MRGSGSLGERWHLDLFSELLAAAGTLRVAGMHCDDHAARRWGLQLRGTWREKAGIPERDGQRVRPSQPAARSSGQSPPWRRSSPWKGTACLQRWGWGGGTRGGDFYTRLAAGQDVPAVTSASSEVLGLCPRGMRPLCPYKNLCPFR